MAVDDVYVGCSGTGGTTVLHVAPGVTNATDDGSEARPFRSLAAARDAMRHGAGIGTHRVVLLQGADYYLDATFELGSQDSGSPDATITYASNPSDGRRARVSGGKLIPPEAFDTVTVPSGASGVLATSLFSLGLDAATLGALDNPWPSSKLELFYGGAPMTLARDPNIAADGTWMWAGYETMSTVDETSFELRDASTSERWRAAHEGEGGELWLHCYCERRVPLA